MNITNPNIKPSFFLTAIEETEYWDSTITARTGRIWTIYLYDSSVHTHLCEFTPSLTLYPCYFWTERHLDDKLHQEVYDAWLSSEQNVSYVHVGDVKPLLELGDLFVDTKGNQIADPNDDKAYEEHVDAYIGEMTCNGEPLWFEDEKWHTWKGPVQ
jgi:hypothetical protein